MPCPHSPSTGEHAVLQPCCKTVCRAFTFLPFHTLSRPKPSCFLSRPPGRLPPGRPGDDAGTATPGNGPGHGLADPGGSREKEEHQGVGGIIRGCAWRPTEARRCPAMAQPAGRRTAIRRICRALSRHVSPPWRPCAGGRTARVEVVLMALFPAEIPMPSVDYREKTDGVSIFGDRRAIGVEKPTG